MVDLPAKTTRTLRDGDVISLRTPGGGGFGDPTDRDPDAVRRDVQLGKISRTTALDTYGLAVEGLLTRVSQTIFEIVCPSTSVFITTLYTICTSEILSFQLCLEFL